MERRTIVFALIGKGPSCAFPFFLGVIRVDWSVIFCFFSAIYESDFMGALKIEVAS